MKNLIVGTAQFNSLYGINNNKKKLTINEFQELCIFMKKIGLRAFDSAESYNKSHINIKKFYGSDAQIISKILFDPNIKKKNQEIYVDKKIFKILKEIKEKSIYGILIHNPNIYKSKNFLVFYNQLLKLKKKNIIKKIGFSIYKIKDVEYVIKNFKFNILQFPINLFDQRLLKKKIIEKLKKNKIELHIRSIFLQGLLLTPTDKLKKYFLKWKKHFLFLDKFLFKNKISRIQAIIVFLKNINFYKKIVIGIDNRIQLYEFINMYKKIRTIKKVNFKKLSINDEKLILPYLWKNI
jgi:hypothetical protein